MFVSDKTIYSRTFSLLKSLAIKQLPYSDSPMWSCRMATSRTLRLYFASRSLSTTSIRQKGKKVMIIITKTSGNTAPSSKKHYFVLESFWWTFWSFSSEPCLLSAPLSPLSWTHTPHTDESLLPRHWLPQWASIIVLLYPTQGHAPVGFNNSEWWKCMLLFPSSLILPLMPESVGEHVK